MNKELAQEKKVILTHEWISLASLTRDVAEAIAKRVQKAGIEWEHEDRELNLLSPYIYGSPVHLKHIFLSIYENCVERSCPGGKIKTVLEAEEECEEIVTYRWTISDTGARMSQELLDHIFEPEVQKTADDDNDSDRSGWNLAAAKKMLDQMHGNIEVKSELGPGSKFVITIPFETAPAPEELPAKLVIQGRNVSGLKVLLAEDDDSDAENAKMQLMDAGAMVIVVKNGKEALESFESNDPGFYDVILMDMPGLDGPEAVRAFRELPREDAKTIPIIAVTENTSEKEAGQYLKSGMAGHIAKPYQIDELTKMITSVCRREK